MRNGAKAEVQKKVKKEKKHRRRRHREGEGGREKERGGEGEGEREGERDHCFSFAKENIGEGGGGESSHLFLSLALLASLARLASRARLARLSAPHSPLCVFSSLSRIRLVLCSPPTAPSSFFIVRPCRAPISFSCTKRDQKRVSCTRRAHPCRHPFPASPKSCHPLPPLLPSPRTLLLSSTHRGFGRDATISLETPAPFTPPPPPPPPPAWAFSSICTLDPMLAGPPPTTSASCARLATSHAALALTSSRSPPRPARRPAAPCSACCTPP